MKMILIISAMILGQLALGADQVSNNSSGIENPNGNFVSEAISVFECARMEASEACKAINMTPAQKQSYMDAKYTFEKAKIQAQSAIKLAKLDYMKNVMSDTGTESIATTVTADTIKAATDLLTEKMNFVNKVLFQILDVNQRKLAVKCMEEMKKMHRMHRGKTGTHPGHEGHPAHEGHGHEGHPGHE